jgi:NAD(P)-dependent dehydrogenase (short-subunit alcohol dehydrogenase family)
MNKNLQGRIILVTGGSGLLGKSILEDILVRGGIAINLDINLKTDIAKNQVTCDITSLTSIEKAIELIINEFGRIDGLVNNAYPRTDDWGSSFEDMPPESLRKNVDWQLNSYLNFCRLVMPQMKKQRKGSIVNMASIYGVVGNDFTIYEGTEMEPPAAYAAIKGGLINATRFLASRYGKENIRVNCVSPGGIFDNQPKSFVKAYEKKVPMKRMGRPDDIAPPVSFLLSDDAKYITGQNLLVDGGWTVI